MSFGFRARDGVGAHIGDAHGGELAIDRFDS